MKKEDALHLRLRVIHLLLPVVFFLTALLIWVGEKHVIFQTLGSHLATNQHSSSVARESEDKVVNKAENTTSISPLPAQSYSSNVSHNSNAVEGCNYSKGRWIADDSRPLYSGNRCKRWLLLSWACRLSERPDFSYERFRWRPLDCDLPEFNNTAFLTRMQNKTIALVGDSLGRQQFQSLMCMATGGDDHMKVLDVGEEYGLVKKPGVRKQNIYAYRFSNTNTTIVYYWSTSLTCLNPINETDLRTKYAMHLDKPAAFLSRNIHRFNVLVLNTGHHWTQRKFRDYRWKMYVNGKPNEDKRLSNITNARNFTIHQIVNWADSQMSIYPKLKVFFRTLSPKHFVNGDWDAGGSCDELVPLTRGSEVMQDRSGDEVVSRAVKGTKVKILDITELSKLRNEGHVSRYSYLASKGINDCLHWCLPGIPDTWNELLIAQV